MRAALASIEPTIVRAWRLAGRLAWPLSYAMALGVSGWSLTHRSLLATLGKNRLPHPDRVKMGLWIGGAGLGLVLVFLAVLLLDRRRTGSLRADAILGEFNRRLVAVLALPIVATVASPGIESVEPIGTVLLSMLAAALVAASAYAWGGSSPQVAGPESPPRSRLRGFAHAAVPFATGVALLGLWAAYGFFLSRLAVTNHHALNTRTIDLGYYDNVFYNSVHGRPLGCTFVKGGTHASAHFDPILVVLSPLYLVHPRAEFLLVLQAVWLGMGVVPAYLIGRSTTGHRSVGWVMAIAYAAYPALHGANLYEFHSLSLIAPLVLWLFYFLEQQRWWGYGLVVVLLCLCREDLPLMLGFVGIHAILSRRAGLPRAGLLTIAFAGAYYLVVRGFFMPSKDLLNSGTEKAYSYAYYFDELIPNKRGLADVALTLLTNPIFVVKHAFGEPQKILYLLVLFAPLAFLPLLARGGRLTLVYGLLVCLLASRKPVFQIGFQYSAMIFPFAFAVAPRALADLTAAVRERRGARTSDAVRRACLAFMLTATFLLSWKFGALVENTSFRGGFSRIARWPLTDSQQETYAQLRSLVDRIEPGASVIATNRIGAHVSNRREVYLTHQHKTTDYALIEEHDLGKQRAWYDEQVAKRRIELVERAGPFALWRRTAASLEAPEVPAVPDAPPPPDGSTGAADPGADDAR